ncbi:hypothetical protein DMH02_026420 [Streptomyces sp. WAC 00631]|uniref:hypothetical protein n=1 Tax=Streptomyces sp. WAC 00631 TaxID=2203201 RepID=UPI000F793E7C|nr:hypothetical protein [Streptomyces sp. WAC 00631]MCC5036609.1 hypothetical protein [Streptomyces sp. WAC 00631]
MNAILMISVSVLMQAATLGSLTGRLTPTGSLALSCIGFAASAVIFNTVLVFRDGRFGGRGRHRPRRRPGTAGLTLLMNLLTAVTFLSFYLAISQISSALASAVETAMGPVAVLLIGAAAYRRRPSRGAMAGALLLVLLGLVLAWQLAPVRSGPPGSLWVTVGALLLVVVAGFGAAGLALVSSALGRAGVGPTETTARRFHLTYVVAGLLLLRDGNGGGTGLHPALLAVAALCAVTVPLFLLQIGLQRADPLVSMTLLTALPGTTYLVEVAWGGPFDWTTLLLIMSITAIAVARALREARPPAESRRPGAAGAGPSRPLRPDGVPDGVTDSGTRSELTGTS